MKAQGRIGAVLVALQFALILVLAAIGWPALVSSARLAAMPALAWVLGAGGMLLGLWAISANRPGNFNIRPTPRPGGRLVETGPYRWIRHPMYTSVLAIGLACVLAAGTDDFIVCGMFSDSQIGWSAWIALLVVLLIKAGVEERALREVHPGYADYCTRTRRLVPFVF